MSPRHVKAMEEMIRRAEADAEHHEAEAARLRESIKATRFMIERYGANDEADPSDDAAPSSRVRPDTKEARNALWEILTAADGPMHARDLLVALQRRGIEVRGKDPTNNVRAHLSHDDRFTPVGSGEWNLASRVRAKDRAHPATTAASPSEEAPAGPQGLDRWSTRWVVRDDPDEEESNESSPSHSDGPSEDDLLELDRLLHASSLREHRQYGDMDDVPF